MWKTVYFRAKNYILFHIQIMYKLHKICEVHIYIYTYIYMWVNTYIRTYALIHTYILMFAYSRIIFLFYILYSSYYISIYIFFYTLHLYTLINYKYKMWILEYLKFLKELQAKIIHIFSKNMSISSQCNWHIF